jgi:hypothetical protein
VIFIGPPAEEIDLTAQDDAQKNLEAVRAMVADSPRPRAQPAATQ